MPMAPRMNLQHQFRNKIGEVAYTSSQVSDMLSHLGLDWFGEGRIRKYVREHGLTVNAAEFGITPLGQASTTYWIPKSKLTDIIRGMNIAVTEEDLETAAYELDYQI